VQKMYPHNLGNHSIIIGKVAIDGRRLCGRNRYRLCNEILQDYQRSWVLLTWNTSLKCTNTVEPNKGHFGSRAFVFFF